MHNRPAAVTDLSTVLAKVHSKSLSGVRASAEGCGLWRDSRLERDICTVPAPCPVVGRVIVSSLVNVATPRALTLAINDVLVADAVTVELAPTTWDRLACVGLNPWTLTTSVA